MARFVSFWDSTPIGVESVKGSSLTIPDQSLSVRDILNRYQLGSIQLSMPSPGEVTDDDYIDSYDNDPDLVDALREVQSANEYVTNLNVTNSKVTDSNVTDSNVTDSNVTNSNE